ncbi:hypothetical protein [Salimicrobium halophilum]|uniref:DUF3221 domain-containing protein n=1 Tax=Salimicrobium halophilum TaxID=86666 RepID=A0A1G8SH18_9BACI|nr:hypothetical protein [Salimicrobium halophilum]SDJ28444.1 hypothetical protein SAMN04490247_1456 [Salimicrobium halophilum]
MKKSLWMILFLLLGACGEAAESTEHEPEQEEIEKKEEPGLKEDEIIVTRADGSEEIHETIEYDLAHSTGSIKTINGYTLSQKYDELVGINVRAKIKNRKYSENIRRRILQIEHKLREDNRGSSFQSNYSGGNIPGDYSPVEEGRFEHPYLDERVVVFEKGIPEFESLEVGYGINRYTEDYSQEAYIGFEKGVSQEEIEEKLYEIMSMLETMPVDNGVEEDVDFVAPDFQMLENSVAGEVTEVLSGEAIEIEFCDATAFRNGACGVYKMEDPDRLADVEKGDIVYFTYKAFPEEERYEMTGFRGKNLYE